MKETKILQIIVSLIAVIFLLIHMYWPTLKVDGITLGLLILILIPWMAPLIKSIEVPGVGKLELQEIKKDIDDVKAVAKSADTKATLSLVNTFDRSNLSPNEALALEHLDALISEYNQTRINEPYGNARTGKMTSINNNMIKLMGDIKDFDWEANLKTNDHGRRLAAISYLFSKADVGGLRQLIDTLISEETAFGQYWAIQALARIAEKSPLRNLDEAYKNKLKTYYKNLQKPSDRQYELEKLLTGVI